MGILHSPEPIVVGMIFMVLMMFAVRLQRGIEDDVEEKGVVKGFFSGYLRVGAAEILAMIGLAFLVGYVDRLALTTSRVTLWQGWVAFALCVAIGVSLLLWNIVYFEEWTFIDVLVFAGQSVILFSISRVALLKVTNNIMVSRLPFLVLIGVITVKVFFWLCACEAKGDKSCRYLKWITNVTAVALAVILWLVPTLQAFAADAVTNVAGDVADAATTVAGDVADAVTTASAATTVSGGSREEVAYAREQLTVRKLTPEDLEKLTTSKYASISEVLLDYSLSLHDENREKVTGFSDALTYGLYGDTDDAKFHELEEEILRNPVYGVTLAKALKDKEIVGETLNRWNPWMEEMVAKNANGVSYWFGYRYEVDENGNLVLDEEGKPKFIADENGDALTFVTEEYRCYAATLCTLLERFVNYGVQTRHTIENWCLDPSVKNNDREGIKADYQIEKEALILAYVGKDGISKFVVGFNVHDKRPEFYGEEKEETPTVVPDTPTSTPDVPTPTSTPTPPTPTTTPTPTPPTPTPTPPTPTPTPPTPTPTPPTPTVTPTPTPPTPTPTPTPTPPTPEYHKDSEDGTQNEDGDIVAPNDNPSPGESTNNGEGATESTEDQSQNSDHYPSYEEDREDMEEMEDVNREQRNGGDNNTPSYTSPTSSPVQDNNGDTGNGGAPINTPTSETGPATEADSGKEIDTSPAGEWDGPPD